MLSTALDLDWGNRHAWKYLSLGKATARFVRHTQYLGKGDVFCFLLYEDS